MMIIIIIIIIIIIFIIIIVASHKLHNTNKPLMEFIVVVNARIVAQTLNGEIFVLLNLIPIMD